VLQTEIDLAARRPNNLSPYDLCREALPHLYAWTRGEIAVGLRLVSRVASATFAKAFRHIPHDDLFQSQAEDGRDKGQQGQGPAQLSEYRFVQITGNEQEYEYPEDLVAQDLQGIP